MKNSHFGFLSDRAHILSRKGIEVSKDTISRRLKEAGYKVKVPLLKPLLSFNHMKRRLEWCSAMSGQDWNKVIFSDETIFVLKQYKRRFLGNLLYEENCEGIKASSKNSCLGLFFSKWIWKAIFFYREPHKFQNEYNL